MTALRYIGPEVAPGTAVPLPENWPARDHEEPDKGLAKAKAASGLYQLSKPAKGEEDTSGQ